MKKIKAARASRKFRSNGLARKKWIGRRKPTGAELAAIVAACGTSERTVRAVLFYGHRTRSGALAKAIRAEWDRIRGAR